MTKTKTKKTARTGKGGRPRKAPDDTLSVTWPTRFSPRTYQNLIEKADAAQLSEHELVRSLIDGLEIRSPHRGSDPELVEAIRALTRELNAIGNNANQIALAVNSGRDIQYYWREVGDKVCLVLDHVLETVH